MGINEIDVDELAEVLPALLAGQGRLIDVRETDEYVAGHVAGAVHVPLGSVPDRIDDFRCDGPVYVICKVGGRSLRACETVALHGIETTNIAGGTFAWVESGRDVIVGDAPR